MNIALQLYSVRDYTRGFTDLINTLEKVAKCGYKYVETAGYYGLDSAELTKLCEKYGLKIISSHTGLDTLMQNFDKTVQDHIAFGAKNIAVPGMSRSMYRHDSAIGVGAFAEKLNDYTEKLANHGIALSYHNHAWEFDPIGNSCAEEIIFETAPLLNIQVDVGNAFGGGADPCVWLERYINRIKTIHYKDVLITDGKHEDSAIGEGSVDWKAVAELSKKSGAEYLIVEVEQFSRDPFDILKCSYDNIQKMIG